MNPGEKLPNPGESSDLKGFMTTFVAMDGRTDGDLTTDFDLVAIQPVRHKCKTRMKKTIYVPMQRPPLLALDQQGLPDFPVNGGSKVVNLASEYYWMVYEKPDWVHIGDYGSSEDLKGGPTNQETLNEKGAGWRASKDLRVTILRSDSYNEWSEPRSGWIKICARDDENATSCTEGGEEAWVKVTQLPS